MFQQVNLYQPIFREEQKLFSATTIGAGLGIIAAGLVLIALYSSWQISKLNRELQAIEAQNQIHAKLVEASNSLFENGETEKALTSRVNTLAFELDRRQQALRYLGSGNVSAHGGFATRMEALAREQIDGLWLKGATFTAESGRFALTGSAVNAELVPLYSLDSRMNLRSRAQSSTRWKFASRKTSRRAARRRCSRRSTSSSPHRHGCPARIRGLR